MKTLLDDYIDMSKTITTCDLDTFEVNAMQMIVDVVEDEIASMRKVIEAVKPWVSVMRDTKHTHTECDCVVCNLVRIYEEYEKKLKNLSHSTVE